MKNLFYLFAAALLLPACSGGSNQNKGTCTVGKNLMTVWCKTMNCDNCVLYEDGEKIGPNDGQPPYNRKEGSTYECKCE